MNETLKIWICTILVSPFALLIVLAILNCTHFLDLYTGIPIYFLMVVVGLILSIPTMIIFYFLNSTITKKNNSLWKRKLILSFLSFSGVWLTFYLLDNKFMFKSFKTMLWPIIYSFTMIVCVCIILKNGTKRSKETNFA